MGTEMGLGCRGCRGRYGNGVRCRGFRGGYGNGVMVEREQMWVRKRGLGR